MRKLFRISTLAALVLGAAVVTAQAQEKQFGLLAGANFATINGSDISDGTGTRTGFAGGIFFAIPVGGGNWDEKFFGAGAGWATGALDGVAGVAAPTDG
mgnify:CR=1 FL=1